MATDQSATPSDGTTGGTDQGGRRTHIIQVLTAAKEPMSAGEVAERVGVHLNTARFHLESLVEAGLARRDTEVRAEPGRRRVLYSGALPNQTHERAQGYRLLAEILTATITSRYRDIGGDMYSVGEEWGRFLTHRPAPNEVVSENALAERVTDKLDALWFAAEYRTEPSPHLLIHNCPFLAEAERAPQVVCALHAGMINGSLEELRSSRRLTGLWPHVEPHLCRAELGPATAQSDAVPLHLNSASANTATPGYSGDGTAVRTPEP